MRTFESYGDMVEYSKELTGYTPYSGVGICVRGLSTCILRSVDDTPYYADDLNDEKEPVYTLFGHNGDQEIDEPRFNRKLLSGSCIYLYRVHKEGRMKRWSWYGKYEIVRLSKKRHPGKDGTPRNIVLAHLRQIN